MICTSKFVRDFTLSAESRAPPAVVEEWKELEYEEWGSEKGSNGASGGGELF